MPFGEVHSRGEGTGKPLQPDPAAPLVSNIAQPLGHTRKPRADHCMWAAAVSTQVAVLLRGPEPRARSRGGAIAEIRGAA